MDIVIMTRGRTSAQHTLNNLPKQILQNNLVYLCHPPEERHTPDIHDSIPEPWPMNYSEKFQWLLGGADGVLRNKICIIDDDLRFCARDKDNPRKLVQATQEQICEAFRDMHKELDTCPIVGMHPRAMGHETTPGFKYASRQNAVHCVNREALGYVKVDQFPILADIVMTLRVLTRGERNAILCDLFWDQVGTSNAPGGCSLHRTWEQQRDAVLGLKEMFPDYVTVKQKTVKDGWWGADKPRYDFIIQWKKAYECNRKD